MPWVLVSVISFLFGLLVVVSPSLRFPLAAILMLVVVYGYITNLSVFLMGLFIIRPVMDSFLISIRVANLGLGGAVSLVLTIAAFFNSLMSPRNYRLKYPIFLMYAGFCFVSILSFVMSEDKPAASKVLFNYFSVLSVIALTLCQVDSLKTGRLFILSFVLSVWLPIFIGFFKYMTAGGRFVGTFGHPNITAFFILIILGCLLFKLDSLSESQRLSFKRIILIMILSAALLLTETRSGWASFVLMMSIYALLFNRRLILPLIVGIFLLSLTSVVQNKIANVFDSYGDQIQVNEQSSFGWRLTAWQDLWEAAQKKPILGYGIGASYRIVKEGLGAHNDYLRYLVEQGAIGFLAYFVPYVYILGHAVMNYRRLIDHPLRQRLAGFLITFIPAFLIMSVSENLASYIIVQWYFWGVVSIYFVLAEYPFVKDKESLSLKV